MILLAFVADQDQDIRSGKNISYWEARLSAEQIGPNYENTYL